MKGRPLYPLPLPTISNFDIRYSEFDIRHFLFDACNSQTVTGNNYAALTRTAAIPVDPSGALL
jgi:hypothetical protein